MINRCTIHNVVEVFPNIWQHNDFVAQGVSNQVGFREVSCPVCMAIAQQSLQELYANRHLIILSTPAALL
jgi:hypothetical protein